MANCWQCVNLQEIVALMTQANSCHRKISSIRPTTKKVAPTNADNNLEVYIWHEWHFHFFSTLVLFLDLVRVSINRLIPFRHLNKKIPLSFNNIHKEKKMRNIVVLFNCS